MKQFYRFLLPMLACMVLLGCHTNAPVQNSHVQSELWTIGDRYPSTYSTLRHAYTYEKDGQMFYLTVSKSKKGTASSSSILSSEEKDGHVYTLSKSSKKGNDTKEDYTYYECVIDPFLYTIGITEPGFQIESILSMQEAIDLIEHPTTSGVEKLECVLEEWTAYERLESCNLEISVFPEDYGKQYAVYAETYEQRSESGEPFLFLESEGTIVYTNGVHTVLIRQTNRSGTEHTSYNTLSECKAILAMLGTQTGG